MSCLLSIFDDDDDDDDDSTRYFLHDQKITSIQSILQNHNIK